MASKEKSIRVWLPPVVNKEYELYDRQFQVHVRVVGVALACVVGGILVPEILKFGEKKIKFGPTTVLQHNRFEYYCIKRTRIKL